MSFTKYNEDNIKIFEDRYLTINGDHTIVLISNKPKKRKKEDATEAVQSNKDPIQSSEVKKTLSKSSAKKRKKSNPVILKRECKSCGKTFELRKETIYWYRDRGLSLPLRCSECRDQRRKSSAKKEVKNK